QIIMTVAAIVAVVLLFQLPKAIVTNEKPLGEEKSASNSQPERSDLHAMHKTEMPEEEKEKVSELRKNFLTFSNKEKKIIFADSIAGYYKKYHQYDSVAYYLTLKSELDPSEENLISAGDAYFDAFTFAPDSEREKLNKQARDVYRKVLDQNPKNLDAKCKLAMTYIGGESTMQGVTLLREVIEVDPKNELALYNLGILSLQSGQSEKAIERFKDLIKVNPVHSAAHFYLGIAFMNMGNNVAAKDAFTIAKKLDSDPEFQSTVESYLKDLSK
ncbi:MAG TPA: tetratricopeptide repeat protein, partial [Cytophagaceae bacterium]